MSGVITLRIQPFIIARPLLLAICCAAALPTYAEESITVDGYYLNPISSITTTHTSPQHLPGSDGAGPLKNIPGFSVLRSGGSNGDPVLRGMFGSRLTLFTDGVSTQGGCGSRMDTPTAYITPQSYDTITVIKGPQSVLWGPMGSAGTLLFERQPEYFNVPEIKGTAGLLWGANGRADQNLNLAFGDQRGYVRLDGNRSAADDYKDGHDHRVQGLWRKWNSGITVGLTPDDDTLAELSVGASDGKARYAGRMMDGSRFARKSVALRLEKYGLNEHLSKLSWQGYINDTDHIMDNYSLRQPVGPKRKSEVGGVVTGSRFSGVWEGETTSLTVGTDMMRKSHRKKNAGTWRDDARFTQAGLFSELRQTIAAKGAIVAGARLDRIQAKDQRSSQNSSRHSILPGTFTRYEYHLQNVPALFYSGIGYTERFPDYWELFSAKAGQQSFRQLKTEKTLQWDSGIQMQGQYASAWASAYVGRIADYILFDYSHTQTQASNIDAAVMGAEAGASWNLTPGWTLTGNLSYAWGENRSDKQPLPQMPPLEGRLALDYTGQNWSSGLTWRVVAPQRRVAQNKGNVTGQDLGSSAGFGVLSWSTGYMFTDHIEANVGIENLFNKYYSEHLNLAGASQFGYAARQQIPEPGRTWWLDMTYHF